jgi:hypothetical protein
MQSFICSIVTLFILNCTHAQDSIVAPLIIDVRQQFKEGQEYHFEITQGMFDSSKGESGHSNMITDVIMKVTRDKDDNIICSWNYGRTESLDAEGQATVSPDEDVLDLYKGLTVEIEVDDFGSFVDLNNYEACKYHFDVAFERFLRYYRPDYSEDQLNEVLVLMEETYSSPVSMISGLLTEIDCYYSMFSSTLNTDSIYTYIAGNNENYLGVEINTTTTVVVKSIENNVAYIEVEQSVSKESLEDMKNAILSYSSSQESQEMAILENLNVYSVVTYAFDIVENKIREFYFEKTVTENGKSKVKSRHLRDI